MFIKKVEARAEIMEEMLQPGHQKLSSLLNQIAP